ncbi:protein fantom isoform X2 [Betta splendens]|uniref:Protein fantom isoform X2 n=1 Tax=Betta splendens TaxID=158456 RepID=A0A8M1HF88_BETSP|nr:protein fantom isoform X2 [Betta splendens]
MSTLLDETAGDAPVRDVPAVVSGPTAGPSDSSAYQNAWAPQDISRVSREELEDRFLRLHDETLVLKQHIHKQDDKIKKLGTKLLRLVKDRGRMEQLALGEANPVSRVRDVEMEEMMEELQEKVRGLQTDNEGLKQRLLVAKQQLMNSQSRRPSAYGHVQSRVNSGLKKLRDDTLSPQTQPKCMRSLEGGGRPPIGQLPRYGHSLLEEARAEVRNLENVIESQQNQMEEMEVASELLREELRRKEAEYEEKLLQVRQQQTSKLRSHVKGNVTTMRLQKQLADRSTAVTELEARFLQIQEKQQVLKASHDTAMLKVDELSAQLNDERIRSMDLEKQLQSASIPRMNLEQLQEQIRDLEQERERLRENNEKLVNSAFDVSQQQKWQIQEQLLKLQITQLETALKADLADKNKILDRIRTERDVNEMLTEKNKKLQIQFLEQKQQIEELNDRLAFYSRENDHSTAEITEAVLQIKTGKSQRSGDLSFLKDVEEGESSLRKLRAAHAETIQELEKTRNVLSMESRISEDYKAELEVALKKMDSDKLCYEQKLEQQAKLLDTRASKIRKLEAQLRDIAYGTRTYVSKPDITAEDEADDFDGSLHLERGENVLEFHILHSTPEVKGHHPKYSFTSKYVVRMDEPFLHYLHKDSLTVELHQALGLGWRTLATGRIGLQQLLEQEGKVHGTIPLMGLSDDMQPFGSVDYWLRLRIPMPETICLYKDRVKALGDAHAVQLQTHNSRRNKLFVTVHCCRDLQSTNSQQPSPYVVYKFFDYPDNVSDTVNDCCNPHFNDLQAYCVLMDADLDQYLKSEVVHFYVFDNKEEQMDLYLGKASIPLLPLAQDQGVTGVFELAGPSGLPAGHIDVTLKWKSAYVLSGSTVPAKMANFIQETEDPTPEQHREKDQLQMEEESEAVDVGLHPSPLSSKTPLPKQRQKTCRKDGPAARKQVKFVDASAADNQVVSEEASVPRGTAELEDDDESHVSEGQLLPTSSQSYSDDSEVSEEIMADTEDAPAAKEDESELTQSDSDDCIVHGQATGRKPSERLRVEVVSLSLRPESRVAQDSSVVRLFVEYSLLDLPTEETPVSLPKPPLGKSINFNFSKVIPVDAENNETRRHLLKGVLQGRNPSMERIRFTVVSEPPEEEEQERECEDIGVAFIRIPEILEKQRDLNEASLNVVDMEDISEVIGTLRVSVEGLEALQAIVQEQDRQTLLPS